MEQSGNSLKIYAPIVANHLFRGGVRNNLQTLQGAIDWTTFGLMGNSIPDPQNDVVKQILQFSRSVTGVGDLTGPNAGTILLPWPEKFIPLMISQALAAEPLPIYGDGKNVRDWIHVEDHCRGLDLILRSGTDGQIYNVGGGSELENIVVARKILKLLGRPESLLKFVADRPAHDRRYALDCRKLKNSLGWEPRGEFEMGLRATIDWYQQNADWLRKTKNREYRKYLDRHYPRKNQTLGAHSIDP